MPVHTLESLNMLLDKGFVLLLNVLCRNMAIGSMLHFCYFKRIVKNLKESQARSQYLRFKIRLFESTLASQIIFLPFCWYGYLEYHRIYYRKYILKEKTSHA